MPNYGLVANSINNLADRLERGTERERAHKLDMLGLGLRKAQMDLARERLAGEQALGLAKAEKDAFLSEVVTGRQAIMDSKWSPEQKNMYIKFAETHGPKGFLDGIAFPRGVWAEKIGQSIQDYRKEQTEQDYRNKLLGLRRKEVSAREKTARDTRSPLQKNAEYIQQVRNVSPQEALDEEMGLRQMGDLLKLYTTELESITNNYDLSKSERERRTMMLKKNFMKKIKGLNIDLEAEDPTSEIPPLPSDDFEPLNY